MAFYVCMSGLLFAALNAIIKYHSEKFFCFLTQSREDTKIFSKTRLLTPFYPLRLIKLTKKTKLELLMQAHSQTGDWERKKCRRWGKRLSAGICVNHRLNSPYA